MNKLWVRLSLTFSAVVLVAVLIVVVTSLAVTQFNDDRDEFTSKVLQKSGGLVDQLEVYYQSKGNWSGIEPMLIGAQALNFRDEVIFALADSQETIIYHPQPGRVGQRLNRSEPTLVVPIQVDRQTVGFLELVPVREPPPNHAGLTFWMRRIVDFLLVMAALVGVGGIVFGILMSRTLTAPLNNLAAAARSIGRRNLEPRVKETGTAEMIAVARAFNEMVDDLQQAEQLRRNLLADVAHELRTPLAVLQANLRAILDEVYPLEQAEIARLYEQTRFLSRLVNDLHELAQAEAKQLPLNRHETDLAQLARTTTEAFRPEAEAKGVLLQLQVASAVPDIVVDAARLTQVLQNLLANAMRHTPSGGVISIHIEPDTDVVCLTVADTGDGIPPEHLPHIFDRFYRADPARSRDRGGTGLGLAIARAIVEAHGGQIKASSSGVAGQGSAFTVQLPLEHW
jgi:signal transduction histidine kinase